MGRTKSKIKKRKRKVKAARALHDLVSRNGYTPELKLEVLISRNEITEREYNMYKRELETND
ncbi:hypothetical protein [Enterococcus termitis]|uniref:Uncharacterized protein n=1 Tax=Enterococcus termitis TaxID=332950 RepID=A0A1E5H5R8_9ENTE|nr:hypothetical protein [Enterococcus termitis]OEG20000.1 hypothetical protein BCR25_14520 [Enterococcus termitis]